MHINERIISYIKAVYPITSEEEQKIFSALLLMKENEQKIVLVEVYNKYESFINNLNNLKRNVALVGNSIKELKEKQNLDNLFENII